MLFKFELKVTLFRQSETDFISSFERPFVSQHVLCLDKAVMPEPNGLFKSNYFAYAKEVRYMN